MAESNPVSARDFRAFHINDEGHVRTFTVIEADTEADAIAKAQALSSEETIELWQRARLIACFPKAAEADARSSSQHR